MPILLAILLLALANPSPAQLGVPEAQAALRQGQAALERGDFEAAITALEQARQLAPNRLEVARPLMQAYLQAREISKALQLGRADTQAWPADPELRRWFGLAYFKTGDNAQAREELQRAEKLDGASFGVHFDLALVLLLLQDYRDDT